MAFLTIEPEAGLAATELERAVAAGPPEVRVDGGHEALLTRAGFTTIDAIDVTAAFHETQLAWSVRWSERKDDVVELLGEKLYDERQEERRLTLAAIQDGLLRRTLYIARATQPRSRSLVRLRIPMMMHECTGRLRLLPGVDSVVGTRGR